MDLLIWLEKWYSLMCDGAWEHLYGITIETLDNPGWSVVIDVLDTPLEMKRFERISKYVDDNNWICCQVKDGKFDGGGDASKLKEILEIFKKWVED